MKVRIHHCWSPTEVKQFCYSTKPRFLSLDLSGFEHTPQDTWWVTKDFHVIGTQ